MAQDELAYLTALLQKLVKDREECMLDAVDLEVQLHAKEAQIGDLAEQIRNLQLHRAVLLKEMAKIP